MVSACRQFEDDEESSEETTSALAEFLDYAALESGDGQADPYEDSVQMMTLHSAKGLEFNKVFIVGLEEGVFPSKQAEEEPGRMEEERRLCYVGITRAMEKLFVTYAENRRMYGQDKYNPPSRFLKEIPAQLLQEIRIQGSIARPSSVISHSGGLEQDNGEYQLGQRVYHAKFGEGVVLNFEGRGPNARLQVNFYDAGSKWLVAQYARLEICN